MMKRSSYVSEHNALVAGSIASLKRALYTRKQIATLDRNAKLSTGPSSKAIAAAIKTLESVKTFKGEFEKNPGTR